MISNNIVNMPSITHSLQVGVHALNCIQIGDGPKLVLAFHGYANDATMFQFLLHPEYTVLSIDLPFQGQTVGVEGEVLQKIDLKEMTLSILDTYGVQKIGLVGFSLGCRACLCIAEMIPEQIRNIVLIAPDGTKHNYFYRFLTSTAFGRFSFRGFVRFGRFYLSLFSILHTLGILNRSMYKFALQYIRTPESRQRLYNIWFSTRKLIPRLHLLRKQIRARHIPVHLLMGQQDKIISLKNAIRFKGHNPHIFVHVFERGHNLLDFEEVRGTVIAWLFRINSPSRHF